VSKTTSTTFLSGRVDIG